MTMPATGAPSRGGAPGPRRDDGEGGGEAGRATRTRRAAVGRPARSGARGSVRSSSRVPPSPAGRSVGSGNRATRVIAVAYDRSEAGQGPRRDFPVRPNPRRARAGRSCRTGRGPRHWDDTARRHPVTGAPGQEEGPPMTEAATTFWWARRRARSSSTATPAANAGWSAARTATGGPSTTPSVTRHPGRCGPAGGGDWSGAGVWRSRDGGETWELTKLTTGAGGRLGGRRPRLRGRHRLDRGARPLRQRVLTGLVARKGGRPAVRGDQAGDPARQRRRRCHVGGRQGPHRPPVARRSGGREPPDSCCTRSSPTRRTRTGCGSASRPPACSPARTAG